MVFTESLFMYIQMMTRWKVNFQPEIFLIIWALLITKFTFFNSHFHIEDNAKCFRLFSKKYFHQILTLSTNVLELKINLKWKKMYIYFRQCTSNIKCSKQSFVWIVVNSPIEKGGHHTMCVHTRTNHSPPINMTGNFHRTFLKTNPERVRLDSEGNTK